ncbi:MAG: DUF935 family protein [Bacteroidales bacterium]|nr:DUF935 family protein [Bacteroidales bacterium]
MDYTQRTRLYDMYQDVMLDTHMISVVEKRKNAVLGSPIEFWRDGVPDEAINTNIKSPWFSELVSDILDAQFWGFTLAQFSTGRDGFIEYFNVPRKHVDPQLKIIKRHQSDISGVPFSEYPGLLFVRGKRPLGIFAACLPWVIRKNGTVGDWCQFSELFGMPIRDYAYDASDEVARARTLADAMTQGSASVYIHPEGTKLSFIEAGNKTGSGDVYDGLVKVCNAELSKAILGNTLTTEASETGTQALGTVHKKEEEGFTKADKTFVLNVLNYDMTDIFTMLGINTDGGEFVFADTAQVPATEKASLFKTARNDLNLPIDDDYIYQELGIEKPKDYERLKEEERQRREEAAERMRQVQEERGKEAPENRARFFAKAPDYGALNW